MKALIYQGPGKKAWEEVPDAAIQEPTDVVVRVDTTTICGTDLHILKGDLPDVTDGRILGHEGIGIIEQIGPAVTEFKVGDQCLILDALLDEVAATRVPGLCPPGREQSTAALVADHDERPGLGVLGARRMHCGRQHLLDVGVGYLPVRIEAPARALGVDAGEQLAHNRSASTRSPRGDHPVREMVARSSHSPSDSVPAMTRFRNSAITTSGSLSSS